MQSNNELIQELSSFKKLPKRMKCDINNTNTYYKHLTFYVKSLADYITVIKLLNSKENYEYNNESIVYRGMSDSDWILESSLERNLEDELMEHYCVNEFLTTRPEAFQGLSSNFEVLAKMQHYGLPTRLLDFTLNPLIALYFACESFENKDGRVVCGNASLSYTKNDIIELVCGTYDYYDVEYMTLEEYLKNSKITTYKYLSTVYNCIDNRLLFAKPKYWNQRIINQSAVFLVFPNALIDRLGKIAFYQNYYTLDNVVGFDNTDKMREQIRKISEIEGSDIYSLIGNNCENPLITGILSFDAITKIISKHKQTKPDAAWWEIESLQACFDNRFTLDSTRLNPIDSDTMQNLLSSVIVSKKHKKTILEELAVIGIDRAFVYPELEYTAQKIKEDYKKRREY